MCRVIALMVFAAVVMADDYQDALAAMGQANLAWDVCQEEYGAIAPLEYDHLEIFWDGVYWHGRYESEIDMLDTDQEDEARFAEAEDAYDEAYQLQITGIIEEDEGHSWYEWGETAFAAQDYAEAAYAFTQAAWHYNWASDYYADAVEAYYVAIDEIDQWRNYCYGMFLAG